MRTLLRHRRRISRSAGGNFLVALFLLLLGAFMLLPIYYTVVNSLKPIHELFLFPPRLYVTSPTLDNFRGLIRIQGQAPVPFERYDLVYIFPVLVNAVRWRNAHGSITSRKSLWSQVAACGALKAPHRIILDCAYHPDIHQ